MMTRILPAIIYFGVCSAVIFVGWEQPLRYRFLSPQQIAEIENPQNQNDQPVAVVPPSAWQPAGTSLDRAPYQTTNHGVRYTGNIDSREMGTRSEQEKRRNLYGGDGGR